MSARRCGQPRRGADPGGGARRGSGCRPNWRHPPRLAQLTTVRLGRAMKLVVAGKGGSGKTSISGTMARALARDGHSVLAIDGDSNPNLALTLGIPAERMTEMPTLPRDLLRRTEEGPVLSRTVEELRAT